MWQQAIMIAQMSQTIDQSIPQEKKLISNSILDVGCWKTSCFPTDLLMLSNDRKRSVSARFAASILLTVFFGNQQQQQQQRSTTISILPLKEFP